MYYSTSRMTTLIGNIPSHVHSNKSKVSLLIQKISPKGVYYKKDRRTLYVYISLHTICYAYHTYQCKSSVIIYLIPTYLPIYLLTYLPTYSLKSKKMHTYTHIHTRIYVHIQASLTPNYIIYITIFSQSPLPLTSFCMQVRIQVRRSVHIPICVPSPIPMKQKEKKYEKRISMNIQVYIVLFFYWYVLSIIGVISMITDQLSD
eukprot:TRINITY_DN10343_c2_g1_i1.p1 TRINITY_DN10343_c2_g1~~TRINITY_DN10343_c2_g1_i1.p1  ORF type:complete len:203 (-),score=-27.52 TRINITY_DN10343_c2_g1_i1:291-899(-)